MGADRERAPDDQSDREADPDLTTACSRRADILTGRADGAGCSFAADPRMPGVLIAMRRSR